MDITEIIERLKNIAGHAVHTVGEEPFVMSLDDGIAVHEAIELLEKADANHPEIPDSCNAETVPAIPLDWINNYINWLNSISTAMAAADVNAIKSMLTKWKLDNGGPVCGPDYCEIGGTHNE